MKFNDRKKDVRRILFTRLTAIAAGLALSAAAAAQNADEPEASESDESITAYKVGKIVTMDENDRVINNAVLIVKGDVIEALGKAKDIEIPENAEVVEYPDCWLVPGLVEAHNHTAGSMADLHDYVWLTNPGLSTREAVEPDNPNIERSRAGGVTTALLIPGSGTNMSGFGTVVKLGGSTMEESVIKSPGSIKIAQAGNPERYWWRVGRMLMNYNTRHTMEKARDYHLKWKAFEEDETDERPAFDPTYHGFRGLFQGQFVASVHTQAYQVVMTTVDMLADKLDIRTTLDHSTFDGWKAAPVVLEQGEDQVITINGPRQYYFDRSQRKIHGNAARWWQGGIRKLGINTDSPVIPQEELSYQAAMACWYGWKPYEALAGVTRVPAEGIMVEDRVGHLAPGMDADFAIWTGDPIDPRSSCKLTVINGAVEHDNKEHSRF